MVGLVGFGFGAGASGSDARRAGRPHVFGWFEIQSLLQESARVVGGRFHVTSLLECSVESRGDFIAKLFQKRATTASKIEFASLCAELPVGIDSARSEQDVDMPVAAVAIFWGAVHVALDRDAEQITEPQG